MIGGASVLICIIMSGVGVYMHTDSIWLGVATATAIYAMMPWHPNLEG